MNKVISIIGAGLAGCECAWILANNNIKVKLYEMNPENKSELTQAMILQSLYAVIL